MKIILIVAVLFSCLISCKKDEDTYYEVDLTTKSVLDWHTGSYWIMKDSTTGQIDSFYVQDYQRSVRNAPSYTYEWIQFQIVAINTITSDSANFTFGIGKLLPAIDFTKKSEHDAVRTFNYFIPFEDSLSNKDFWAGAKAFTNVYSATVLGGEYKSGITDTLHLAVNQQYGLIKLKITSAPGRHNWTLIRSFIKRS